MKKKAKASNRNRHTGHINSFKELCMSRGKMFKKAGRLYFACAVGDNGFGQKTGITIVRGT